MYAIGVPYTSIDKQKILMGELDKLSSDAMKQRVGVWDRALLEGVVVP